MLKSHFSPVILCAILCFSCGNQNRNEPTRTRSEPDLEQKELVFEQRQIADSLKHIWAHVPVDLSGDGIGDLVYIYENASGGYLAYRVGMQEPGIWKEVIIAQTPPDRGLFASGDMECGDMDGDGDMDVIAVRHPGEWIDAGADADLFWYENPSWTPHFIGTVPDAVKDVSVSDFNRDRRTDLAVMTFETSTLSIFEQQGPDSFERIQFWENFMNLHEGMGLGDVNGDGWNDIIAGAVIFTNPAGEAEDWRVENLDPKWNTQTGDWSRNATKAFLRDLDGDGHMEIFISHSERAGYPVSYYKKINGAWEEHVVCDSLAACHTLQVFDFDLDGDFDVLAGSNKGRAVNLGKESFEVMLFLAGDDYANWTPLKLSDEGIYNGQAIDYDGDGDMDIFRYPEHESEMAYLLENKLK
jgi:hypothetical protein